MYLFEKAEVLETGKQTNGEWRKKNMRRLAKIASSPRIANERIHIHSFGIDVFHQSATRNVYCQYNNKSDL